MNILQMSLSAGFLIFVVAIIRAAALNRLPKKMFLILWGVVLLRLLVPFAIPVTIPVNVPVNIGGAALPGTTGANLNWHYVAERPSCPEPTEMAVFPLPQGRGIQVIWLGGMVTVFLFFAFIYYKNYNELRFATRINGNKFLDAWVANNKLRRVISVLQSDRTQTPLAVGIFRPKIILPKSMDLNNELLLNYVLFHEYYHIARFDALWKLIFVFALCVHWFNPMVWLMFVFVNRDLELTCDELVLRRFGAETKTAYAYTLIAMAEARRKFAFLHDGFSKNAIEERIVSIMKTKRKSFLSILFACVLVSVLAAGSLPMFIYGEDEYAAQDAVEDIIEYAVLLESEIYFLSCDDKTVTEDFELILCDINAVTEDVRPSAIIYHHGMYLDYSGVRAYSPCSFSFGRTIFIDDIPPLMYIFDYYGNVTALCISTPEGRAIYDYFSNGAPESQQDIFELLDAKFTEIQNSRIALLYTPDGR